MQGHLDGTIISYETWASALFSSACIGFTSLVPWMFNMTFFEKRRAAQQSNETDNHDGDGRMKLLLSFAVGAMLGDIFFHLIPESFQTYMSYDSHQDQKEKAYREVGLSIIAGIFMFIIVEMCLERWSDTGKKDSIDIYETTKNDDETVKAITKLHLAKLKSSESFNHIKAENDTSNNNNNYNKDLNCISSREEFLENNNNNLMTDMNSNQYTDLTLVQRSQQAKESVTDDTTKILSIKRSKPSLRNRLNRSTSKQSRTNSLVFLASRANSIDLKKSLSKSATSNAQVAAETSDIIDSAGYLNLIANGFDNFTHGLAIGASFLVSVKVGLLTTFVIFIHEVPHEICDYAILVNSGFSRWDAVRAQSSISLFGMLGTATALYVKSVKTLNAHTVWILPFSAGGFLHIALVNILPEILDQNTTRKDSIIQVSCVLLGVAFMAAVAVL